MQLERIAQAILGTTLFAYLGIVGDRYLIQGRPVDHLLFMMIFLLLLRSKIGLDDMHYYSTRQRKTKAAVRAVAVSLVSYIIWILIPFLAVSNLSYGISLACLAIILSTASISFTALDLDSQLRSAGETGDNGKAMKYAELQRFYDEQPYWIIANCMYEICLIFLLVIPSNWSVIWGFVLVVLIILVVSDFVKSRTIGYLTGFDKAGAAVVCKDCGHLLGVNRSSFKFCPNCGYKCL
jgi:hypothetical protein